MLLKRQTVTQKNTTFVKKPKVMLCPSYNLPIQTHPIYSLYELKNPMHITCIMFGSTINLAHCPTNIVYYNHLLAVPGINIPVLLWFLPPSGQIICRFITC